MATYDKCRHCKYGRDYLYGKCYECKNGSNFKERILDEQQMWISIKWWRENIISMANDIQKFSTCLRNLDIYNRAVEIKEIANGDGKKLWKSKATKVKERAEITYKELISEYIKLGKLGLGANAYMNLMCVGEILGYPKSKINEDLSKELEKNGTSIKDNS